MTGHPPWQGRLCQAQSRRKGREEAALLWKLLICSGGKIQQKQSCALSLGFHGKVTAKPLEILWVCFAYI